jgi:hypothetical protein
LGNSTTLPIKLNGISGNRIESFPDEFWKLNFKKIGYLTRIKDFKKIKPSEKLKKSGIWKGSCIKTVEF